MTKLAVALLAIALAGTASAAGWRSLRIDASSEAAFDESVDRLRDKLSPSRRHAFEKTLQQTWTEGESNAAASEREYTKSEYYAQLDGLGYEEVVLLPDPTGEQAQRYRAQFYWARARGGPRWTSDFPAPAQPERLGEQGRMMHGFDNYRYPLQ